MSWWFWVIVAIVGAYSLGGVLYVTKLARQVRRGGVTVEGPLGWILGFALWPIGILADAAVDSMLM